MSTTPASTQYYAVEHSLLVEVLNHLAKDPAASLYSRLSQAPKVVTQEAPAVTPATETNTPAQGTTPAN